MADDRTKRTETEPASSGRKVPPATIAGSEEGGNRPSAEQRRKAAASLIDPAIPPAGAGAMLDADPRLDDRSETERALERASRTPD